MSAIKRFRASAKPNDGHLLQPRDRLPEELRVKIESDFGISTYSIPVEHAADAEAYRMALSGAD